MSNFKNKKNHQHQYLPLNLNYHGNQIIESSS